MLGIFCFARYSGRLSLDHFLSTKFNFLKQPLSSKEYYWPLQVMLLYLSLVYFAAGYQKVVTGGLGWIFSSNMQTILLTRPTLTSLGRSVADSAWLSQFLAFITVYGELLTPLALVNKSLKGLFLSFCCLMHIGAYHTLGADGDFNAYVMCFSLFLPWAKIFKLPQLNFLTMAKSS